MKNRHSRTRHRQAGFSLLEMLITVGILSAAAYVALDTVENDTGQIRYEVTESNLATLRRAMVGDANLAVNGVPVISGFAADTGRLPKCLEALITREPDCDNDGTIDDDTPPVYGQQAPGLYFGWRGPYLTTGPNGMVDGWGNTETATGIAIGAVPPDVPADFGWHVTATADPLDGDIILSFETASLGRDRGVGETIVDSYDADQTMGAVTTDDFQISLTSAAINVEITATSDLQLCIAMLAPSEPDVSNTDDATEWDFITDAMPLTLVTGATDTMTLASTANITAGVRPIVIYDATSTYLTPGSCTPALASDKDSLVNSSDILRRFGVLFVPRVTPAATFRITL